MYQFLAVARAAEDKFVGHAHRLDKVPNAECSSGAATECVLGPMLAVLQPVSVVVFDFDSAPIPANGPDGKANTKHKPLNKSTSKPTSRAGAQGGSGA